MTQAPTLKILFPIDITEPHPEYLEQLKGLLPLAELELVLLYVREELPAYEGMLTTMADFPDDFANQIDVKAKSVLADLVEKLKPDCPNVSFQVVSGPATLMIDKIAKDDRFDLIVMNASSHSKMQKYLLGSTCERVVKQSPISVLILRSASVSALKNVVVGIDGSESCLAAVSEVVSLFGLAKRDVQVTAVNVVHVTEIFKYISPVDFVASIEDNLMMSGEASLAQAVNLMVTIGVKNAQSKLKDGDPVGEILKVAADVKADLVVVGGQGRSALEHLLVGSVSAKLTAHSPCSVLVCKIKE